MTSVVAGALAPCPININNNIYPDKKDEKKVDSSVHLPGKLLYLAMEGAVHYMILNHTHAETGNSLHLTNHLIAAAAGTAFTLYRERSAPQKSMLEGRSVAFGKAKWDEKLLMAGELILAGPVALKAIEHVGGFKGKLLATAFSGFWGFSLGNDLVRYMSYTPNSEKKKDKEVANG